MIWARRLWTAAMAAWLIVALISLAARHTTSAGAAAIAALIVVIWLAGMGLIWLAGRLRS